MEDIDGNNDDAGDNKDEENVGLSQQFPSKKLLQHQYFHDNFQEMRKKKQVFVYMQTNPACIQSTRINVVLGCYERPQCIHKPMLKS